MFYPNHPIVLEVAPEERDRALVWLMKNHPKLDCLVEDTEDDGAQIRVAEQDAAILEALADLLDRP